MVGKNANYATNITVDDEKESEMNGGTATLNNSGGLEPAARSANALWKRAEQLKRWQESETNRENPNPLRGGVAVSWVALGGYRGKVKFSDECVFLAACASGDIDEVDRLLELGADINTTNVDGMTALHQAVIDQNLDVVQYLVENGADIDAQDNEGWTPLMAGVSCDFMDIVRYLLDKGASPTLVNSDGELPIDLTDSPQMRSLLQQEISRKGINLEEARHQEEHMMMRDALDWLNSPTLYKGIRHPRTGATAVHVASAKGYIKVLNVLLQAGCDVNAVDFERWTPLHAAAHWGERQACEILVEHMADMDAVNNANQTCFDVADSDELCQALEELKKKQEQMKKERKPFETLIEQNAPSRQAQEYKIRKNSITRISTDSKKNLTKSDETKEAEALRTASSSEASDNEHDEKKGGAGAKSPNNSSSAQSTSVTSTADGGGSQTVVAVERKRQEAVQPPSGPPKLPKLDEKEKTTGTTPTTAITTTSSSPLASVSVTVVQPTRTRQTTAVTSTLAKTPTMSTGTGTSPKMDEGKTPSPVTQPHSKPARGPPVFVPSDPPTPPWRSSAARRGIQAAASVGAASSENGGSQTSASAAPRTSSPQSPAVVSVQVSSTTTPTPSRVTVVSAASAVPTSPSLEGVRWRAGRFEKSAPADDTEKRQAVSESASASTLRSFTPPQRSDESEAERKVRAKRERESRRSTQGVTLETVKLAEQIHGNRGATADCKKTADDEKSASKSSTDTKTSTTITKENKSLVERPSTIDVGSLSKPSASGSSLYPWRTTGRISAGESASDTAKPEVPTPTTDKPGSKAAVAGTPPPFMKRLQAHGRAGTEDKTNQGTATDASSSIPATSAQSTASSGTALSSALSANIPNRKRLRNTRRSTGPVAQEDVQLALESDQGTTEDDSSSVNGTKVTAGGDQKQKSSKPTPGATIIPVGGSTEGASPNGDRKNTFATETVSKQLGSQRTGRQLKSENVPSSRPLSALETAELDYKKLYEREKAENERLLEKIKYLESLIESTRLIGTKTGTGELGQPLSDRERITLEKRIAQLEEETKVVEQLRSDNQRLKEENGALIRVISKLSK